MNYPAHPESIERTDARRFSGDPVTAFADLAPIPSAAEFIAQVDLMSGTRWEGDNLVRFAPELTDEECDAINEAEDAAILEREDRDEELREKQYAEQARYGRNSGE